MAAQAISAQDINALTGKTYPAARAGVPSLLALLRRPGTTVRRHPS